MRASAIVVMDAYSGETHFYVVDENEPITRTWRKVYPSIFDSMSEMPADLREHIRYGEDLFNYQASALQRFHVTDVNTFFSNNEAWARTQETRGRGTEGQRVESPARYTYAVLPGEIDGALRDHPVLQAGCGGARHRLLGLAGGRQRAGQLRQGDHPALPAGRPERAGLDRHLQLERRPQPDHLPGAATRAATR